MDKIFEGISTILAFILVIIILGLLLGFPIMWMWNYIMPALFGLKCINFYQALVLYGLTSILFKDGMSSKKE
jgi:hypothetical protein